MRCMAQALPGKGSYTESVNNESNHPISFKKRLMLTVLAALLIAVFHSISEADQVAQTNSGSPTTQASLATE